MWPFKRKPKASKAGSIEADFADISHWEKINFDKYKKKLLITKATEAENYVDPTFKGIQEECKKRGLKLGAYHFFRCDKNPLKQANHFISIVKEFDLAPVLDIESMDGESVPAVKNSIKIWLDEVEKQTKMVPIIYSGHSFLVNLKLDESFARYPLWLARYTNITPTAPAPWKEYWAWQFSDHAKVDGIGECDGNVFGKKV
jgi:lysozyme